MQTYLACLLTRILTSAKIPLMSSFTLTPEQNELVHRPLERAIFLEGPAGSGKTTVGVNRLLRLLQEGVPPESILLLTPQRTLAAPYVDVLSSPGMAPGGQVQTLTVGGLARRMCDLFWPMVAEQAGFARPDRPPSFLTLETALYYMAYLVRPLLEEGLFDSVTIDRNRIYSQILDNLNKAAIVGFPHTEISLRLREGWVDSTVQANVLEDAQRCANLFRSYCLQNNLLDYSLQMELFTHYLWPSELCRDTLTNTYRHLLADNIEEDTPAAHDLLADWLPQFESALLIFDQAAGFRQFLGADPESAHRLVDGCDEYHIFTGTLVTAPGLVSFCRQMGQVFERDEMGSSAGMAAETPRKPLIRDTLARDAETGSSGPLSSRRLHEVLNYPVKPLRFYPQMLDWVMKQVVELLDGGTPPREIVLLAPLLPDSLRFALANRLEVLGIPYRSHRPSRSLRDEPAAQALLTLAELAHPHWEMRPTSFEVAQALIQSIQGLDLVRAQLLTESVYTTRDGMAVLTPFDMVRSDTRERITYGLGNRYERLRRWIDRYIQEVREPEGEESELDFFFSRLFGEVLSQADFAFHTNLDAGQICANLIESAQKFRWAVEGRQPAGSDPERGDTPLGQEYVQMIQEGILAAQYIQSWQIPPEDGVLVAPAYTFLLANQPVDHQFWLDVGNPNWSTRLLQPLTHPQVLTRRWQQERDQGRPRVWTDVDEYEHSRDTLYRLTLGLARRCRKRIHLGLCEMNESGYESKGMLLKAIYQVLQQSRGSEA